MKRKLNSNNLRCNASSESITNLLESIILMKDELKSLNLNINK